MIGCTYSQTDFWEGYYNIETRCLKCHYVRRVWGKCVGGKPERTPQQSGSCKLLSRKGHTANWLRRDAFSKERTSNSEELIGGMSRKSTDLFISLLQLHWVTWNLEGWLNSMFKSYIEVLVLWGAILGSAETTFLGICVVSHNDHEIAR